MVDAFERNEDAIRALFEKYCGGNYDRGYGHVESPFVSSTADPAYYMSDFHQYNYQWQSEKVPTQEIASDYGVDDFSISAAQMEALKRKIDRMCETTLHVETIKCLWCGGEHASVECQVGNPFAKSSESANFDRMGESAMHVKNNCCLWCGGEHASVECQVGNPFAKSSEHANFDGNFNRQQNYPYSYTYEPAWENHPNFSWSNSQNILQSPHNFQTQEEESNLVERLEECMMQFESIFQARENSFRNLEVQIQQIIDTISERPQDFLPNDIETNPKEQVQEAVDEQVNHLSLEFTSTGEDDNSEKLEDTSTTSKGENLTIPHSQTSAPNDFVPPISFPQHVVEQKPSHAKFTEEILSKKRNLEEHENVMSYVDNIKRSRVEHPPDPPEVYILHFGSTIPAVLSYFPGRKPKFKELEKNPPRPRPIILKPP